MKTASSKISGARVSLKHAVVLCKELKGMKFGKARTFLEDLIKAKKNIDGKYYSGAAKNFLEMFKSMEANVKQKNLNVDKLFIKKIKADKGLVFYRPRSLWHLRGQKGKSVNLMIEVEER